MKKRVLLGTPLKGNLTLPYVKGLVSLFRSATPQDDAEFLPLVAEGTYVNFNRNDLVETACHNGFDELLMVDSDMEWMPGHARQIRSHAADIVGAAYCKRKPGEPEMLFHPVAGAKPDERGLLEVNDVAAGFLWVRTSVFTKLREHNPHLHFHWRGDRHARCNFFPIQIFGPNTAEARLAQIKSILADITLQGDKLGAHVFEAAHGVRDPGVLVGEDYSFCRLAKEAGFKIYADTKVVLRHVGPIRYPAAELPLPAL